MRIPEIREEMADMALKLQEIGAAGLADKLMFWAHQLVRRPPVRRAPPTRRPRPDPSTLLRYADAHPQATYMEIGERFGCSTGRVSEALAGYRD